VNLVKEKIFLEDYELVKFKLAIDGISIYRRLREDEVISKLYALIDYVDKGQMELSKFINLYNDFYFELSCNSTLSIKDYIIDKVIYDENFYSQRTGRPELSHMENLMERAVMNDLDNLQLLSNLTPYVIKFYALKYLGKDEFETKIIENLSEWQTHNEMDDEGTDCSDNINQVKATISRSTKWSEAVNDLGNFYRKHGCGIFARYRAFIWERTLNSGYLRGIEKPDPVTLSELIGYDTERSKVIENTLQFINSFPANNVLLYGDRGTGKSTTVKALVNEYYIQGLRIVEVAKEYIGDFPEIIRSLKGKPQKFIIFIDDLAFEDNEENYTSLKAVLEGSMESKPDNVLIYATSNRRHLVKEYFSDRAGLRSSNKDEEVHAADSIQEKLSLSDRFGITVVFSSPDKNKFLEIVEGIAAKRNIDIDKEQLRSDAQKWEVRYNGRSPRTARQFVDWLEGRKGLENLK
jgi:uncharacterized protein